MIDVSPKIKTRRTAVAEATLTASTETIDRIRRREVPKGDAHTGEWHRQVSLLAQESIDKMRAKGLSVVAGDFAENLTTQGIDAPGLQIGDRLTVGETELEVTQINKECHARCAI